jgi:DNA replication protein DnaC
MSAQTHALKLPRLTRVFELLERRARDAPWSIEEHLHVIVSTEQLSPHESVSRQWLREARFPEVKTLDTFDFPAAEGVYVKEIHTLARGEKGTAPEHLILARPMGTGNTSLAMPLGVEANRQKRRALTGRAAELFR